MKKLFQKLDFKNILRTFFIITMFVLAYCLFTQQSIYNTLLYLLYAYFVLVAIIILIIITTI